eukprot:4628175-Pleurochrysis_carterae.AAC.1
MGVPCHAHERAAWYFRGQHRRFVRTVAAVCLLRPHGAVAGKFAQFGLADQVTGLRPSLDQATR